MVEADILLDRAASNPHLLECVSSWLREITAADIVKSPIFDTVINALSIHVSFEAAVDCMCTIFRDTREVDEYFEVIQMIYPRLLSLRPKLAEAAESDDLDTFKGLTRMFAEAAEAWTVMIARLPMEFRGLVESILECCARDRDREAISLTFLFWYELKQMIVLEKYKDALNVYSDVFAKLVDIMIKHLEYPTPEGPDENDLFDGDREQEERFREFRHQMGDVLKDCCDVITVKECLDKAFDLIRQWIAQWGPQASSSQVPHWQELEAPLFSMRAMGSRVSPEENLVLKQVIPLIVQIPDHEKLRFQAIMALGRYTDWTAQHPEFLEPQLNFVMTGFSHSSTEVVRAAALAFQFFGRDCKKLLQDHVIQLHGFYESVFDKLPSGSREEITEGVACVISAQQLDNIYPMFKLYCDPVMKKMMSHANGAKNGQNDSDSLAVAGKTCRYCICASANRNLPDHLQLLTIFVQNIQPYVSPGEENPAVKYCQEILPVMSAIAENFTNSTAILETVCRCWRNMVLSYRTAILPMLSTLAQQLASGFQTTRQGCFLWATDSVLREFAVGAEFVDAATSHAIYNFFETQAVAFLRIMNSLPPNELPDGKSFKMAICKHTVLTLIVVIEDFFHLLIDALIYHHQQFISASICEPTLSAAISTLTLQQYGPLTATLHFLRDFLSYGTNNPNSSSFGDDGRDGKPRIPIEIQQAVKRLVGSQGEVLVQRILTGMMFHFPRDCFADASGVLLALFEIIPQETAIWVKATVGMLPSGTVKSGEADRLMNGIGQNLQAGEIRRVRVLLQGESNALINFHHAYSSTLLDFANSYRRRNVAPREGLGRLEATRFRFAG